MFKVFHYHWWLANPRICRQFMCIAYVLLHIFFLHLDKSNEKHCKQATRTTTLVENKNVEILVWITRIFLKSALSFGGNGSFEGIFGVYISLSSLWFFFVALTAFYNKISEISIFQMWFLLHTRTESRYLKITSQNRLLNTQTPFSPYLFSIRVHNRI